MLRACKAFAVALLALLALGAAAQSASALPITVEGTGPMYYTGEPDGASHEFVFSGLTVKCTAVFAAQSSLAEGATIHELTLTPNYTGCTAKGSFGEGKTTDVKLNGCTYTFTTPSMNNTGEIAWIATTHHLVCPAGKSMELTPTSLGVSICTQLLPAQTATAGRVVAANKGTESLMDITMEAAVRGIHYSGTGSGCADGTTHTDGEYKGNVTLRAFKDAPHTETKSITFSPPTTHSGIPITGDQDGGTLKFETPSGSIECVTVALTAYSASEILGELTVAPHFTNCKAFGFVATHISVNECVYTFTTPTALGKGEVTWGGEQFHLVCPIWQQIEVTPTIFGTSLCTHFIGPQTPTGGHIVGRNKGAGGADMDVTLEFTLSGLHYTGTGSVCGDGTTHTDGVLTGNSTLRGSSSITVS